jgi:glycosyltransferase involved in cell wall biosynthesis
MPRVLVSGVVLGQPMGGVRRHNAELLPRVAGLLERGGGGLAVLEGEPPIPFPLPPEVERIPSDVRADALFVRAPKEGKRLKAVLRAARDDGRPFDVVHTAHLPVPGGLPVPYVLTLHDLRDMTLDTGLLRSLVSRTVIRDCVKRAACTIAVSETVRDMIEAEFDPRRTAVVPNAGDHLTVLPRVENPAARLLHIGHIEPRKNLELLVRALALDPLLPDVELVGASKKDERTRLQHLARTLDVRRRVHFLGSLPDERLPALYAQAACAVIPSALEGFGIGVLEAQRARAPLCISNAGALPEVAGPDVPSFPPDDVEGAVSAIRQAVATPLHVLDEQAARAGRYSWMQSAELLAEAWRVAAFR